MNVRTKLRTVAAAAAISMMVLSSPAGLALAAPNDAAARSCRARGYVWDSSRGCNDKSCDNNGKLYKGGDVMVRRGFAELRGVSVTYYCDGFTGKWVKV